ncbi:MAG: hypothetical protein ACYCW6_19940 [Candidatus Xenobia bacterium]
MIPFETYDEQRQASSLEVTVGGKPLQGLQSSEVIAARPGTSGNDLPRRKPEATAQSQRQRQLERDRLLIEQGIYSRKNAPHLSGREDKRVHNEIVTLCEELHQKAVDLTETSRVTTREVLFASILEGIQRLRRYKGTREVYFDKIVVLLLACLGHTTSEEFSFDQLQTVMAATDKLRTPRLTELDLKDVRAFLISAGFDAGRPLSGVFSIEEQH